MNSANSPLVTFGLPAVKAAFLRQAIDSILAQTVQDFELVIVNDASQDDISGVVGGFDDPRIRYYVNEHNLGKACCARNWNRCLSYARGAFFVLASDDDLYAPAFLEKMLSLAAHYPDVTLFHCRVAVIDQSGDLVGCAQPCLEYERPLDFIYNRTVLRRQQVAPDFMCRTEALRRCGGFAEIPAGWYSDDITWFHLCHGGVAYASEVLFKWRVSGLNISSRSVASKAKVLAGFEFIHRLLPLVTEIAPLSEVDVFQKRIILDVAPKVVYRQMIEDASSAKGMTFFGVLRMLSGRKSFPKRFLVELCARRVLFSIQRLLQLLSEARRR